MPEYLAPAVYVEETSFRSKSIAGVGTSTTAFVGPTARGPRSDGANGITPPRLTSPADFEQYYGGIDDLRIGTNPVPNYLAHAVQAFFRNGGGRLYVARVTGSGATQPLEEMTGAGAAADQIFVAARFPGGARITGRPDDANYVVTLTQVQTPMTKATALRQPAGSMVRIAEDYYIIGTSPMLTSAADATAFTSLADTGTVSLVTLTVEVQDSTGLVYEAGNLAFDARHPRFIGNRVGALPQTTADRLTNPIMVTVGANITAISLRAGLMGTALTREVALTGGTDGTAAPTTGSYQEALDRLAAIEDVSIVAAPGASAFPTRAAAVNQMLIGHAETRRAYRIAVLDAPPHQEPSDVQTLKGGIDSTQAALYYPWIEVANPLASTDPAASQRIALPPSGFVCGIYARNDVQRGVWKSPANETVTGALDLQRHVRFGEQEILNPLGINCIRALPNRGIRVWGARTISSDPEWTYVAVRRYFLYLEASIDRGTQWAVFEPNGPRLWDNVRTTISDFLYNEWVSGALLGDTPEEAFFVRCDRSTMTQNDLDNGRMICLIGVAALKPAEFVIFRIGQTTAGARE